MVSIAAYVMTDGSPYIETCLDQLDKLADTIVLSIDEEASGDPIDATGCDHIMYHSGDFPRDEPKMRKPAYEKACEYDPDFVISIDDDELVVDIGQTRSFFETILNQDEDVHFVTSATHHMWERKYYRKDAVWNPKKSVHILAENMNVDSGGEWSESGPHCGRVPTEGAEGHMTGTFPAVHLGWFKKEKSQKMKMMRKIANDHENIKEDGLSGTQFAHYCSFFDDPQLERIPEAWDDVIEKALEV